MRQVGPIGYAAAPRQGGARMNRVSFLSAGEADGSARREARPQWMRDAVLAISRAALQRGLRLRISADPLISPMVLTVACEFPPRDVPPVEVYRSKFFSGRDALDIHEIAKRQLGLLEETEAGADEESS